MTKNAFFKISGLILCLGAATALGGCSSIGKALGFSKRPPDEFEVVSKAPLVVPPDYNLRPPGEEEVALRDKNPKEMAFQALFPPKPRSAMPALPSGNVGTAPLDDSGSYSEGLSSESGASGQTNP